MVGRAHGSLASMTPGALRPATEPQSILDTQWTVVHHYDMYMHIQYTCIRGTQWREVVY